MGQYYKAWLKERETEIVFEDNDGNLKLLEHAYFGSDMTEAVMRRLYMRMHRVVWCGDYDGDNLPNVDKAGRWAGDFISCENTRPEVFYFPDGTTVHCTELDVVFTENYTE